MLTLRKLYAPSVPPLAEADPTRPQVFCGRPKPALEQALGELLGPWWSDRRASMARYYSTWPASPACTAHPATSTT
jgi:hypothetical protein